MDESTRDDDDDERFERIPLTAWDRLCTALERACKGSFERGDDTVQIQSGAANLRITREGVVDAGMPLHGFSTAGVEHVDVDTEHGELRFQVGETTYRFRQP